MTRIDKPDTIAAGVRAAQGLESPGLATLKQTPDGIQSHLWAFVDIPASEDRGEAIITARSTTQMLRALGIATIAGGQILTKPFSIPQGHPSHAELDRMKEGIRDQPTGIRADTGTYDKATGGINADKAIAFWGELTQGKGYATVDDVNRYVTGATKHDFGFFHTRAVGRVINETEIRLFFDVAAQISNKGERVLTPDRFVAFLDGTLWQDLAKARAAGTLYQPRPVGEIVHEGPKKVATGLAKLAASYGGVGCDAGTSANHQANLTIDTARSLDEQQRTKTLLPTVAGAMRALCPLGYG